VLLTDAVVVTPDRLVPGGTVVVEDGTIVDVVSRRYPPGPDVVDLAGRYLLPGLVDLHNDAIETAVAPRPGGRFPVDFALLHLDRALAAAGVTTQFHAVSFSERDIQAGRTLEIAAGYCRAIRGLRRSGEAAIDHQTLLRLDLRTAGALDAILTELDELRDGELPVISLNDHVPGQGQYRDAVAYARNVLRNRGEAPTEQGIAAIIAAGRERRASTAGLVEETLRRVAGQAARRRAILVSHDDDSPERVALMHRLGCRIAEFPVTVEAAAQARRCGMAIAMGAANAFRGGSLTGNAGALDLLGRGLVDILVADYAAPALLAALFRIVDLDLADLPAATRLVTANPAAAVGLLDRGTIGPGKRADLVAVEHRRGVPVPTATMVGGEWRLAATPFAAKPAPAGVA